MRLLQTLTWQPFAILAASWLFVIVYAYPGMMTFDSIEQLEEARAGLYSDGHPPLMAAIWRIVDAVLPGPFGMLVLQTVPFLAGLYLVLRRAMEPSRAAVVASLIFIFPPVLAPMAVIWKDSLMAGFLMLGTACLLEHRRWLGLLCLVIATALRYNTPAATFALILLLVMWDSQRALVRSVLSIATWIAVTIVATGISAALTTYEMNLWPRSLALYDIAGTLAEVDETIPDTELRETLAGTKLLVDHDIHAAVRRVFKPTAYEDVISGELWNAAMIGKETISEQQRAAVSRAFWDTVTSQPGAYLRHRLSAFREVNYFTTRKIEGIVMIHRLQISSMMARVGLPRQWNDWQSYAERKVEQVSRRTPLFRPWIYLLLTIVFLPLAWRGGHRDVVAILLSGLGMQSSLLLLAATTDYRYSHWLVVCTCVAVAMLIARRYSEERHRTARAVRPGHGDGGTALRPDQGPASIR